MLVCLKIVAVGLQLCEDFEQLELIFRSRWLAVVGASFRLIRPLVLMLELEARVAFRLKRGLFEAFILGPEQNEDFINESGQYYVYLTDLSLHQILKALLPPP